MRKEKIILSIIAASVGILVALGAFFFYQSTRKLRDSQIKKIVIESPTPNPNADLFLNITTPKDEDVVDNKTIKVSGNTVPNAKIVIISNNSEQAAVADNEGNFSTNVTLSENENILQIIAVTDTGETVKTERTITYSTESF